MAQTWGSRQGSFLQGLNRFGLMVLGVRYGASVSTINRPLGTARKASAAWADLPSLSSQIQPVTPMWRPIAKKASASSLVPVKQWTTPAMPPSPNSHPALSTHSRSSSAASLQCMNTGLPNSFASASCCSKTLF